MKIFFFKQGSSGRSVPYESVSEPFNSNNGVKFMAVNLQTGKLTTVSISSIDCHEVYTERMHETFMNILNNMKDQ